MDFKEHRLVFMSGGGDGGESGSEAGGDLPARVEALEAGQAELQEQVRIRDEQIADLTERLATAQEEISRLSGAERREACDAPAESLTQENPIDKALEDLDQESFEDFMKDLRNGRFRDMPLDSDDVYKLVKFAAESDKEKANFNRIFHAFIDGRIKVNAFSEDATRIMIDHYGSVVGGDEKKLKRFVGEFIKTGETADILIKAAKGESAILKETFKAIKDTPEIGKLTRTALVILIEEIGLEEVMESRDITPIQKTKLLTSTELNDKEKLTIFDDLLKESENLSGQLDGESFRRLIKFAATERRGKAFMTIMERFSGHPEVINKMDRGTVRRIFERLYSRGEDKIFEIFQQALEQQTQEYLYEDLSEGELKDKIGKPPGYPMEQIAAAEARREAGLESAASRAGSEPARPAEGTPPPATATAAEAPAAAAPEAAPAEAAAAPEAEAAPEAPEAAETAESSTIEAIRALDDDGRAALKKAIADNHAYDAIKVIFGQQDYKDQTKNRAKRGEIWTEMGETEKFTGAAGQNIKILGDLKTKLEEITRQPAPEPKVATETPAAGATVPGPVAAVEQPAAALGPDAPPAPGPAAPAPLPAAAAGEPAPTPEPAAPAAEREPEKPLTFVQKVELLGKPEAPTGIFEGLLKQQDEIDKLNGEQTDKLILHGLNSTLENFALLKKFLEKPEAKVAIATMSINAAKPLIAKLHEAKYQKALDNVITNLDRDVKDKLIEDPSTPEEIRIKLHPIMEEAIKRLKLVRINGEYRRKSGDGTWHPGFYGFSNKSPDKIFYSSRLGIQVATITPGEKGEPKWEWMHRIKNPGEVKEVKETAEKDAPMRTIEDVALVDGKGKKIREIPKDRKVTIIDETISIINERRHVKVRYHERGAEGFIEQAFLQKDEQEAAKLAEMDPETKEIYTKYFINFDNVEKTTIKVPAGKYQLERPNNTIIYQQNGATQAGYERDQMRYFTVKNPDVFKITKDGEEIYVVFAEDFSQEDYNASGERIITDSPGDAAENPGYININDLLIGHEDKYGGTRQEAQIESDWTRGPKLRTDETLITGKTYTLNKTTELHEQDHNFKRYLETHPVTVMGTQVREVEGRYFVEVQIKVDSRTVRGWIPVEDIDIPEEDTMFISDQDRVERPAAPIEGLRILGTYTIKGKKNGSELLADIAKKYSTLETKLAESGISKPAYIRLLLDHRDGNTLQIIEPTKTLKATMDELEAQSLNTEYLQIQSEESENIFNNRERYLREDFFLKDEKLKEYINDDTKWNDVWEKISTHENEFIDGIEKVIDIYREFGLQDIEIRDELRELLQIGVNKKITAEEIFNRYLKDKKYEGRGFDAFNGELDSLERDLKYWRSEEGQQAIGRINHFHQTLDHVGLAIRTAQDEGKNFMETQEFKDYEAERIATESIRQAYLYNNIPRKSQRLDYLRTNILNPTANLLDAISGLSVRTSVEQSYYDRHEDMIKRLPELAPPLPKPGASPSAYYDVESLASHKNGLPGAVEGNPEGKVLIRMESEVKDKFETVRKKILKENYGKPFSEAAIIKMVFQLYSLETLAKEKCIKRVQGSKNELVLVALPKNFRQDNGDVLYVLSIVDKEEEIDAEKELITKYARILDENTAVISRLTEIFGTDAGLEKDYGWTEHLKAVFTGADVREIEITMADIGARKVTKPTPDFLNKYMSGKSEMTYIMDRISTVENGVVSYNKEALASELKKRLKLGIYNLFISDKFTPIQDALEEKYKTKDKEELYGRISESHNFEHLDHSLDTEIIALIRLGSVINQLIEENPETAEAKLSENPEIRGIQEAALRMDYPKEDIKKIEDTLLGGIVVSPTGGFSVTTAVNIELGHGFRARVGLSAGAGGVTPGVGISKTFEFTERTRLTVGIHGGPGYVGADTNLDFPISDRVDGKVIGAAGLTVVGFYAAGGIGVAINADAQLAQNFKEQIAKKGFTKVEELRVQGADEEEIVKALMEVPAYGEEFKAAKSECQMSDKALLEVYEKLRTEIDAQVKGETAPSRVTFKFKGAGIAVGVIDGIPFVLPYAEFVVGERLVGVRSQVMGQETLDQFSHADLQAALTREIGQNFELTHESTGETGQITMDAQGKMALLEREPQITDLRKFDTLDRINGKLKEIKAEITQEPDTKLNQLHITVPGDLKVVADPKLGIRFMPHENKILFSGNNADISNLIITREDFFYPYKKDGAQSLTVLTISSNPLRGRLKIEEESPQIIYQREGYKPEIRKGIAKKGTSAITDMPTYMASLEGTAMPEGVERRSVEHFDSWRGRIESATNRISSESFEGEPREGAVEAVAKEFLKTSKNKKLYLELSTIGHKDYNPDRLNQMLQDVAAKTEFKQLTALELAQLHIHLIRESFMNARQSMDVFKRNLEFAKKQVLIPFFKEITGDIQPPLESTPEQMAEQIGKDISEGLDLESKDFAKIDAGAYMLSVVGTMQIKGLRGTTYYGSALDTGSGILNLKNYNPGEEGVKGDIGKALLELLSPIDRTNDVEFMKSKLAIKLAAHDGMYLLLGAEDAMKVAECFENEKVSETNKAAFEKFKDIVLKVREAQNAGSNFVDLPGGYQIRIKTTTGVGAYEKCTNPTMVVSEDISIWAPKLGTTVASTSSRGSTDYMEEIKRETIIIGVKLDLPQAPPQPQAGPGGRTGGGTGGDANQGAGQETAHQDTPAAGAGE